MQNKCECQTAGKTPEDPHQNNSKNVYEGEKYNEVAFKHLNELTLADRNRKLCFFSAVAAREDCVD